MKPNIVKAIVISLLSLIVVSFFIGVSANNKEISIRSHITAQKQVVEAYYDKLWKVISQKAQVAEKYKDAFKETYQALIEGRYGNEKGGSLMRFISESNPAFDVSLYKDLQQSIEAERAGFFMEQKRLIDLSNIRKSFPYSVFIGGRADIPITIVSSSATKKVIETGIEDSIKVF